MLTQVNGALSARPYRIEAGERRAMVLTRCPAGAIPRRAECLPVRRGPPEGIRAIAMAAEPNLQAPPMQLDERAHAVIEKSRAAVEASRQTLEEARALLRRLDDRGEGPLADIEAEGQGAGDRGAER